MRSGGSGTHWFEAGQEAVEDRAPGVAGGAAARAAWDTRTVLLRLGGFSYDRHSFRLAKPMPEGITFARAALRSWPR
jgi:hypothetical protein